MGHVILRISRSALAVSKVFKYKMTNVLDVLLGAQLVGKVNAKPASQASKLARMMTR